MHNLVFDVNKHFLLTSKEQLHDYEFPVYTTEICPRNQTEWKNRSSALHCTYFKGYMCVPNEDFTTLLEFCYSSFKIAVQPGKRKIDDCTVLQL